MASPTRRGRSLFGSFVRAPSGLAFGRADADVVTLTAGPDAITSALISASEVRFYNVPAGTLFATRTDPAVTIPGEGKEAFLRFLFKDGDSGVNGEMQAAGVGSDWTPDVSDTFVTRTWIGLGGGDAITPFSTPPVGPATGTGPYEITIEESSNTGAGAGKTAYGIVIIRAENGGVTPVHTIAMLDFEGSPVALPDPGSYRIELDVTFEITL